MDTEKIGVQNREERSADQQKYREQAGEIASRSFQQLARLPGEPEELGYFKDVLKKVFVDHQVVRYRDDEKFVGSFCAAMPPELIRAAGARPLRLCSNSFAGFSLGNYAMPGDVCPLVKAVVGNVTSGAGELYNACDLFVVPVSCDCKKLLAGALSEVRPTIPLYLPLNRTDDGGMETYVRELKKAAGRISEMTGVKVTRQALAEEIKRQADVQREILAFSKLKSEGEPLLCGTHALAVMNAMAYDDLSVWGSHLKRLNGELRERKSRKAYLTGKKPPRILLTGSPITFPNVKIPLLVEEQGGVIVADETCLGDRGAGDLISVCDDSLSGYYRALANRSVKPCSCPIFPENEARIRRIEKAVRDARIDGIVYHVLRGCVVYDYEFEQFETYFGARGIPVIRLESDFSDEDVEPLRTRVDAFIEMLASKDRNGAAQFAQEQDRR